MVARLLWEQDAGGSSPSTPTKTELMPSGVGSVFILRDSNPERVRSVRKQFGELFSAPKSETGTAALRRSARMEDLQSKDSSLHSDQNRADTVRCRLCFYFEDSNSERSHTQWYKNPAPLSERIEERGLLYIIKNRFAFKVTAVGHNKLICTFQKHFVTVIVNSRQFVFICFKLKCNCFLRL